MQHALSAQLDNLGLSKKLSVLERAQRFVEVGQQFIRYNKPWRPLLSRHEFEEMMAVYEAKQLLIEAVKMCKIVPRADLYRAKPKVRSIVRKELPETLDTEDEYYRKDVMYFKYVRDSLLASSDDEIVVNYKRYFKSDIPKLNELIRPWYQNEWNKMYWRKDNAYGIKQKD